MSKAFTKESDDDGATELPDREISSFPNLVTAEGLAQINAAIDSHSAAHASALSADDTESAARSALHPPLEARDLRDVLPAALDLDRAAMQLRDAAGQMQAQPDAVIPDRILGAEVGREQPRKVLLGHADAVVGHRNANLARGRSEQPRSEPVRPRQEQLPLQGDDDGHDAGRLDGLALLDVFHHDVAGQDHVRISVGHA